MRKGYGFVWREGTLPLATDKLEFLIRGLRLDGVADSRPIVSQARRASPRTRLAIRGRASLRV